MKTLKERQDHIRSVCWITFCVLLWFGGLVFAMSLMAVLPRQANGKPSAWGLLAGMVAFGWPLLYHAARAGIRELLAVWKLTRQERRERKRQRPERLLRKIEEFEDEIEQLVNEPQAQEDR